MMSSVLIARFTIGQNDPNYTKLGSPSLVNRHGNQPEKQTNGLRIGCDRYS